MPRKPVPWPGPDFVAQVRKAIDPTLLSLGFTTFLVEPGIKNRTSPRVLYRMGKLFFESQWDPWEALLEVMLGPRFHMKDVVPRVIVHTHYDFYLEALGLPERLPAYSDFADCRGDPTTPWFVAFTVIRETQPDVISRYASLRPKVEAISAERLPLPELLDECSEG
jgi:hypothetical protein